MDKFKAALTIITATVVGAYFFIKNKSLKQNETENTMLNYKITEIEESLLKLKSCRDKIKMTLMNYSHKQVNIRNQAKEELKKGNKSLAKVYLNRCKMLKINEENANGMLLMIYDQIDLIEKKNIQCEIGKTLQEGNELLKRLNENINMNSLSEIKEDMDSIRQEHDELREFLINNNKDSDLVEKEINDELKELENFVCEEKEKGNQSNIDNCGISINVIQNNQLEEKEEREEKEKKVGSNKNIEEPILA